MPQQRSRKILIYIFLFLIIGTLSNKNLNDGRFIEVNEIIVFGLDEENSRKIIDKLKLLQLGNLFFLDKNKIEEKIMSNSLVEKYSVFKKYPSSLKIKIDKTEFFAQVVKNDIYFFLGSNGKLIKTNKLDDNIPTIIGDFENENFMKLKKATDESNFDFFSIKKLFPHKSGRWDLELESGTFVKLPKDGILASLKFLILILEENKEKKINKIDLRQKNQIILNG